MAGRLLFAAAAAGDVAACAALLSKGFADVHFTNVNLTTPAHAAAAGNHTGVLECLISAGADIHAREKAEVGGYTPLHYAVKHGQFEAAELLLLAGADPNAPETSLGMSPLHLSAKLTTTDIAKLLVARGCDVHRRDFMGLSASYWAKEWGNAAFLAIRDMPPPAAPLVEETVTAFAVGHRHALATNAEAFAIPTTLTKQAKVKDKGKGKGKAKAKK